MGDPAAFARRYYEQGCDEIIYTDIVASLYQRNSILDVVKATAHDVFIPMTVGGGIRSIEDVKASLRAGADKVTINTAAVKDPDLLRQVSETFGSQCLVVAIETIKDKDGIWRVFTDNGREPTGRNALEWAEEVEQLGAGEVLLTSVDREGTFKGLEVPLIKEVVARVHIPVIAHGGSKSPDTVADEVAESGADAVAVAGILHYGECTAQDIKTAMLAKGLDVRP